MPAGTPDNVNKIYVDCDIGGVLTVFLSSDTFSPSRQFSRPAPVPQPPGPGHRPQLHSVRLELLCPLSLRDTQPQGGLLEGSRLSYQDWWSFWPVLLAILKTAPCTQHTALHIAHFALHNAHCTLHIVHCTLNCTLHIAHCTLLSQRQLSMIPI